jgi:hypothetical protein
MLEMALKTAPPLHGDALVVTSAADSHTRGLHPVGKAWDIRIIGNREGGIKVVGGIVVQQREAQIWGQRLSHALGSMYDVVVEDDHIHVEHDEKELAPIVRILKNAPVAQGMEQHGPNVMDAGSNPAGGTIVIEGENDESCSL